MPVPLAVLSVLLVTFCCSAIPCFAAEDLDHPHGFDPWAYPDRAAWERRADILRHQVLVAQGLWPMPDKTPLKPVIHGMIDRGDYTIEKVFFASMPGHYVSGNLYRPTRRRGKLPVVLMPHGHWPDGRLMWRSDADAKKEIDNGAERTLEAARSPLQANCAAVARMGCIVFLYDAVGSADSTKIAHRQGFTDAEATLRLQSFMGVQTWNSIRALDFVLGLPNADDQRVAVTGSSGGGTQTIALAAVDPRVTVSFPMVMVSMNMQGGCVCENAPLYRVNTNNVELACLFAPKPEGAAAANDWTHDFLQRGLPEMKSIWRLYAAEGNVEGDHVDFGHNHNLHSRLLQYRFLNKHLKLDQPEPIEEKPFDPVPPKELSVYDEQHPMPTDFADAPTLRKTMTATSDAQLAKLGAEEYLRTVRTALRAMVVDDAKRDLVHMSLHSTMPDKWNERVVIWWDPKHVESAGRNPLESYAVYGPLEKPAATTSATTKPTTRRRGDLNPSYPGGFVLGYNRSPIAQEVCDLLDMIAQVRRSHEGVKSISLIATGDGAPAALLARALAGDQIDRAAIDLAGFDFDRVENDDDRRLLPGALKYGGIYGFVPLLPSAGATLICNARETGPIDRARKTPNVTIDTAPRDTKQLGEWIVEGHK
jgi:hypothetical protein